MKTYMQLVAQDLVRRFGNDLSRVAVIFPNKRASLFLNQELARAYAHACGAEDVALWSPAYVTISDFFRRRSTLVVADQIYLVCRLYDVYVRCTGNKSETLDQFYSWGVVLLADFDDIDKNMADAKKVFQIVADLHELDNIDYLDDEQREALKEFFSSFTDSHPSQVRERFSQLWCKLYDIYTEFRSALRHDGFAYEGMLYRDVAEMVDINPEYDTCCFVGFNMLQSVEQCIFDKLKAAEPTGSQPRALFYWDYDDYYMKPGHEAGYFIGTYLKRYPDALGADSKNCYAESEKTITYIDATTDDMQARYAHDWLLTDNRWKAGEHTAIVMCDERLLQTVVSSLPQEIDKVNVTTGYPLSQTAAVTLIYELLDMQTERRYDGAPFSLRNVWRVLRNPYIRILSDNAADVYDTLYKKKYYSASEEYMPDAELRMVLHDINDADGASQPYNVRLILWLQEILHCVALYRTVLTDIEREALFKTHQVLQRLYTLCESGVLVVDLHTLSRLMRQIISTTTIPYHGEPVEGVQVMGVLETRCLDFDHLLILSCNEGNMPKGVNDSSFIPHSIRKAYGLTTVEHKVGIFSYYFYRLIQRCHDITITYNSSTEGLRTGEMSRFMQQLKVESRFRVKHATLQTHDAVMIEKHSSVEKTESVIKSIRENILTKCISPTSIARYLRCPLSYYYQYVAALRPAEENNPDDIDSRMFGNIFHKAAENIYKEIMDADKCVHKQRIETALKSSLEIEKAVDDAIKEEVFKIDASNKQNIKYSGLQIINRQVVIRMIRNMLSYEACHAPFCILGNELKVAAPLPVTIGEETFNITVGGYIDRLDMAEQCAANLPKFSRIRVVDYKTGWNEPGKMKSIEDIFSPEKIAVHSDYYLQTMLYSIIVSRSAEYNHSSLPVSPNLLYVQKTMHEGYTPQLAIDNQMVTDVEEYADEFCQQFAKLIAEILNSDIPFTPTSDTRRCEYCDFKKLCRGEFCE